VHDDDDDDNDDNDNDNDGGTDISQYIFTHDDDRSRDPDHRCTVHDDCTLVHLHHAGGGWWFQYHVHASGLVLAVDHDGTSFGHPPRDGSVSRGAGHPPQARDPAYCRRRVRDPRP